MTLLAFEVKWCDRCQGERPHSKAGRCMSLHRTTPLRRSRRLAYKRSDDDRTRWETVKRQVFERDGWRCQRCGAHANWAVLDAHHRELVGAGGSSDDDRRYGMARIITLCRYGCHEHVHRKPKEAWRLGLIIPRSSRLAASLVPVFTIDGWVQLLDDGTRETVTVYAGDDE